MWILVIGYPGIQGTFRPGPRPPATQPTLRSAISARPITGQGPMQAQIAPRAPMPPTVSVNAAQRPTNYKYTANMRNPPQASGHVAQQPQVLQVSWHICKCKFLCTVRNQCDETMVNEKF